VITAAGILPGRQDRAATVFRSVVDGDDLQAGHGRLAEHDQQRSR